MLNVLRRVFGSRQSPALAYALATVAASRDACFNPYQLRDATKAIDVATASLRELVSAYQDCLSCIGIEYPETAEGSDRAFTLMPVIEAAVLERFPKAAPDDVLRTGRHWVQTIIVS